ncbi:MAG: LysR family transcriptional regulator [Paracoccaceae bacterium]
MKWDDLRVFLHVARMSRLVVAGQVLGMDPATVGRRISALEEALGSKLFDRSPQGYSLTDAGRNLVDHAQGMENIASVAQQDVGGQSDRLSGIVRIGAPDGVANYLLTEAMAELCRDNPDLKIQIVALPRNFSLSRREADLAVAVSSPSTGRLKVQKIGDYKLHLYGARGLLETLGDVQKRADLSNVPCIGYISDMIFDKELDYLSVLKQDNDPRLTSNSLIVQLRWALAGDGICILPDFLAAEYPDLVQILPEKITLTRGFYLLRHQDDNRITRINRAAELVVKHLRGALHRLQ